MKTGVLFIFTLFALAGHSQTTINNYKYVLVPQRFSFSKADDQYGLNTTARSLLEKKGLSSIGPTIILPPELAANKCTALKAEVTQKSGFFSTSLTLLLKDCSDNIVFKSKEGKSREKEFYTAYNEALKDAFTSLAGTSYKYDSTLTPPPLATPATTTPVTPPPPVSTPALPSASDELAGKLYAQPTSNGYQLIDTTPKKSAHPSSKRRCPIISSYKPGPSAGIVFKKESGWVFEYYKDDKLISQKLDIKF